ncbi:XdhC/CoxI family protein [Fusobacterium sp.]|uniref:XdhC family protein n=1 Tax=Fusobacterium sp. TaxID=68766 RepID=UPI00290419E0|nr:XdhC/CoxI family protein [Fusobacterium sp.]MDU1912331.1 XdhC/CoxI family protein [Fusobacterium sp.]
MEEKILNEVYKSISQGKRAALVMVTEAVGSTPRKSGAMMGVFEDSIIGTIGGGNIEYKVIQDARELIKSEESKEFSYNLTTDDELRMNCGGSMKGFIKVFVPSPKLLICGAGHIGQKLFNIGKNLEFDIKIIDDREELKKDIPELTLGNFDEILKNEKITNNTYIVIATRGHLLDEKVLELVKNRGAKYIGIIGSKRKITNLKENLEKNSKIRDNIYAPIGLRISDGTPEEIAIEILAEILQVKNNGELVHRSLF